MAWHLFSIGIVLLDTRTSSAGIVLGRAKPPSDASTLRLFIHTDLRQRSYQFHGQRIPTTTCRRTQEPSLSSHLWRVFGITICLRSLFWSLLIALDTQRHVNAMLNESGCRTGTSTVIFNATFDQQHLVFSFGKCISSESFLLRPISNRQSTAARRGISGEVPLRRPELSTTIEAR